MRILRDTIFMLGLLALTVITWAESGRGLNKKLYAVPLPGAVVIDGNLNDWDWSGHFESYEREETRDTQRAECAMMYDDEALYIGAKVKDTSPLMNRHNPAADADKAWMGDCLQVRLVTDRRMPFPYIKGNLGGAEAMGAESGQPLHLMIWYFTDNKEPALQIHKSMAMQPVRAEWGPHGVVPHKNFQAEYRIDTDGKGFTMEYRIPWDTLNAKDNHHIAGDIATATLQFLWGDGSGMVYKSCAYDLMSQPGFPWQDTACWGKLIFAEKGNIPRAWVNPMHKPDPPTPLAFTYNLPNDGETSVALYDKDNKIVRHIAAQTPHKAGKITEQWDGRDCNGNMLPAGDYTWKGLYHAPIKTKYVMSIGNSGQPAWKTSDGTGGWGGDYGPPTAATVTSDKIILGWTGHEAGWGIIGTDLNGKKLWGISHKNASILASDGARFFANGEGEGKEINVYSTASGQPMVFGNKRQGLLPPDGGDATSNIPTGLAYAKGKLYVSFSGRDLVGIYDAISGDIVTKVTVNKPGRLAITADDAILVISEGKIVRSTVEKSTDFITTNIDSPSGIAIDAKGLIYIGNQGKLQNISVFTAVGKYIRSIGKKGGRPVTGKFDPAGILYPGGIAIDSKGKLWVPETSIPMKRISVWNSKTGKLLKEFFGGCSYSPFAWIDPTNKNEAFFDNTIWKIDLKKGTWYPKSTYYSPKSADAINPGNGGFFFPFRVFTANNGKQYAVSEIWAFGKVMWIREGDIFRPLYFRFRNHPNEVLCPRAPFAMMGDKKIYPPGRDYVWADTNKDIEAQPDEIKEVPAMPYFQWMDANLNLYGDGVIYRPKTVSKDDVPTYDFAKPEHIAKISTGSTWTDPSGKQIWGWHDGANLAKYTTDGTREWLYQGLRTWRDAINVGAPGPGTMWGATCPVGIVGRYSGLVSYFGTVDLVRDDGLFVSQVFESGSKGNNGPNIYYVEFLAGQMVQPQGTNKIYILAGDQDCRVSEVIGLDTVKDLYGGIYNHTPELAAKAAKAYAEYDMQIAGSKPLVLARGGVNGLYYTDSVGKKTDDQHSFQVQAAYDATNLYFRYAVTSPAALTNAIVDSQMIFKGGNLLDIQVATNMTADPKRTKPAVGDIRLLISQREGKPWVVMMQPKIADFTGKPIILTSPQGSEPFDAITVIDRIQLRDYIKTATGFTVTAVIPRDLLKLTTIKAGDTLRMDAGYIYGNTGGTGTASRAYWHNNSFTANVVNDIPHESRLEPAEWGEARVE